MNIHLMHADNIQTFVNIQKHCEMKENCLNDEKVASEAYIVDYKKNKVLWFMYKKGKGKEKGKGKYQTQKGAGSTLQPRNVKRC